MWNWIIANLESMGKLVALLTALGGVFKVFYVKVVVPHKKNKEVEKKRWDSVEEALKELKDNGGGSMKDISKSNQLMLFKVVDDLAVVKNTQAAFMRLTPDCMFECDKFGKWIMVNESICRLFGATRDQLLGFGWQTFVVREEKQFVEREWDSGIENDNEISLDFSIRKGRVSEEKILCSCIAHINRKNGNEIVGIFGIINKK